MEFYDIKTKVHKKNINKLRFEQGIDVVAEKNMEYILIVQLPSSLFKYINHNYFFTDLPYEKADEKGAYNDQCV